MKGLGYHERPRKAGAQLARMGSKWPEFTCVPVDADTVIWRGPVRGFQKRYRIGVMWNTATKARPYVYLIDPPLRPHAGSDFESIPHLIYNGQKPALSGLCLFDPDGREWSDRLLIADTTIPWAARWLFYYELWHMDGVWRGGGVGPESVAAARAAAVPGAAG